MQGASGEEREPVDPGSARAAELLRAVREAARGERDQALRACLAAVCRFMGWPLGHAYLRDGDLLRPSLLWHEADPLRFTEFRATTLATPLRAGEGLPGRVLYSGAPAWITDVNADPNFPRQRGGAARELGSAFAFPVRARGQVVAVLEFFSDRVEPPHEGLMRLMQQVSAELSLAFATPGMDGGGPPLP